MHGIIYQLNVKPHVEGERGLPKRAVEKTYLTQRGLVGDYNIYRTEKKNSTLDLAVLVLPLETLQQLNTEGWPVAPGDIGENITTQGIPYDAFAIGTHWRVGWSLLKITEACTPCKNLRLLPYIGMAKVVPFMATLIGRRGMYARILQEGTLKRGASIEQLT